MKGFDPLPMLITVYPEYNSMSLISVLIRKCLMLQLALHSQHKQLEYWTGFNDCIFVRLCNGFMMKRKNT